MVIPRCVRSHEILEQTHPLLVPQACQEKSGMTQRVRDGSMTLDDYDAQSLEVARQVGPGLFVVRIDHLTYDDNASNPLLDDLVIDFDDEPGVSGPDGDSDQSNSCECFTYAMVNVRSCEIPRSVLRYCELANEKTEQLYKVSTPCIDDHNLKKEDLETVGKLSEVCSQIVLKCSYLARIGRPDIQWSSNKLPRAVSNGREHVTIAWLV